MINEFKGKYACLSNFWPFVGNERVPTGAQAPIEWKGKVYATVEHLFQAAKTENPVEARRIREADSPALAKFIGHECKLRDGWEEMKLSVMEKIVAAKFVQNDDLATVLLSTCDEELSEGNWWGDSFWGVDLKQKPPVGENNLGQILMRVREQLRT